jgi:tRNA (guanine37-N1)-methyltransferase
MRAAIVTLFPDMVRDFAGYGVVGRGVARGLIDLEAFDPRAHTHDRHRTVDDRPYGGGPGMVMMAQPLLGAVAEARQSVGVGAPVIYLSPAGERFDQALAAELAAQPNMVLIAGRYEGVDERVITSAVDREISIGDYVLSGGELAALVVLDAVARLLPGVLGNAASAVEESHLDGLLDYPHYTRPEIGPGGTDPVPQVLLSGDHSAVRRWRLKQALKRTFLRRPDMLASRPLSRLESELLKEVLAEL